MSAKIAVIGMGRWIWQVAGRLEEFRQRLAGRHALPRGGVK